MKATVLIASLANLICQHGDQEVTVIREHLDDLPDEFEGQAIVFDEVEGDFVLKVTPIEDESEPAGAHVADEETPAPLPDVKSGRPQLMLVQDPAVRATL